MDSEATAASSPSGPSPSKPEPQSLDFDFDTLDRSELLAYCKRLENCNAGLEREVARSRREAAELKKLTAIRERLREAIEKERVLEEALNLTSKTLCLVRDFGKVDCSPQGTRLKNMEGWVLDVTEAKHHQEVKDGFSVLREYLTTVSEYQEEYVNNCVGEANIKLHAAGVVPELIERLSCNGYHEMFFGNFDILSPDFTPGQILRQHWDEIVEYPSERSELQSNWDQSGQAEDARSEAPEPSSSRDQQSKEQKGKESTASTPSSSRATDGSTLQQNSETQQPPNPKKSGIHIRSAMDRESAPSPEAMQQLANPNRQLQPGRKLTFQELEDGEEEVRGVPGSSRNVKRWGRAWLCAGNKVKHSQAVAVPYCYTSCIACGGMRPKSAKLLEYGLRCVNRQRNGREVAKSSAGRSRVDD
ncbi:hypothetical protein K491DRAFT_775545 [Lophiostoma macrostomum CBS 122681]|uniref:Uncharacterized protein n=1 Tax=Lophiostoma macrostomum CBS 122681 TaxID=1314788 RepID=A0A6A6TK84_9PLEO|nr:hypothetical protein K491DRAFT_775545 [Lophiostoma macrostomum CBS 122681]